MKNAVVLDLPTLDKRPIPSKKMNRHRITVNNAFTITYQHTAGSTTQTAKPSRTRLTAIRCTSLHLATVERSKDAAAVARLPRNLESEQRTAAAT
jgi:hypothetical protein